MGEENLNKDFSNTRRGGGVTILRKFFSKFYIFLHILHFFTHAVGHSKFWRNSVTLCECQTNMLVLLLLGRGGIFIGVRVHCQTFLFFTRTHQDNKFDDNFGNDNNDD